MKRQPSGEYFELRTMAFDGTPVQVVVTGIEKGYWAAEVKGVAEQVGFPRKRDAMDWVDGVVEKMVRDDEGQWVMVLPRRASYRLVPMADRAYKVKLASGRWVGFELSDLVPWNGESLNRGDG